MKKLLSFLSATLFALAVSAQKDNVAKISTPDPAKKIQTVEVSCGQCQFGLKTKKGCDLAVRVNGKAYFVEGTHIDEHGDPHAPEGFCESIRKADIQGTVVNDKFKVSYLKLKPVEAVKAKSEG